MGVAFEDRSPMTTDTRIGARRTGDAGDASATAPIGICAVFESPADPLESI